MKEHGKLNQFSPSLRISNLRLKIGNKIIKLKFVFEIAILVTTTYLVDFVGVITIVTKCIKILNPGWSLGIVTPSLI